MNYKRFKTFTAATLAACFVLATSAAFAGSPAGPNAIVVQEQGTMVTFAGGTAKSGGFLKVRIAGPNGQTVFEGASKSGLVDWVLDANLPDGRYNYDAWFTPASAMSYRKQHEVPSGQVREKAMPAELRTRYEPGVFIIKAGKISPHDSMPESEREAMQRLSIVKQTSLLETAAINVLEFIVSSAHATQNFNDVIKMNTSNPEIEFNDTDDTTRSWDWATMGQDTEFVIRESFVADILTIEDGAGRNALYIQSGGNVGLGTSTPSTDLHLTSFDTPGIRLEQLGGTFTPQTWDIAGHESRFFIRDITNGFVAPFIIRPGAPTSSIEISASGNVGIGTGFPTAPLHVFRTDGTAKLLVENTSSTTNIREMFRLSNNGGPFFIFADTSLGVSYSFAMAANGDFIISQQQEPGSELRLDSDGNLTVKGTVSSGSSRTIKDEIVPVDETTVLAKVEQLDIGEWSYEENLDSRHIGPMAEDFYAIFGLGRDNKHIAPLDLAGVSLAAIKALEAENDALSNQNADLEARLAEVEKVLSSIQ